MTPDPLLARALEDLVGIQSNRSYLYDWAQLRSKRLLTSISPDSVADVRYTYSVPDVVRRTTGIVQRALRLEANDSLGEMTAQSLRLAAEVFEYLAELEEGPNRETSMFTGCGTFPAGRVRREFHMRCERHRTRHTPTRIYFRCRERNSSTGGYIKCFSGGSSAFCLRRKQSKPAIKMDEDDFVEQLRYHDAPPEAAFALLAAQLTADAFEQLSSHIC